uniref:Putative c2h2-type zn-finger protein n=1 Tax=Culex tarsalis TaxID=7177 RepID=A0A1Q3F284_CULTA
MTQCCSLPDCDSSDRDFGTVLFSIPQDVASRRRWTEALGESSSLPASRAVCWNHFAASALLRAGHEFRLEPAAVPTLFLGADKEGGWTDRVCRFCAESVDEGVGSDLVEMLKFESSRTFVQFLLPEDFEESSCGIVCDDCLLQAKLALRFIRNVEKATRKLDRMAQARAKSKSEVKTEMDEFGEITIGSVEPEVKVEVSSLAGFSDRDEDSDYEDDIPLAKRIDREDKKDGPLSCAHCDFTCSKPKQLAGHRKKHKNLTRMEPLEDEGKEIESESASNGQLQCSECPYTCERLVQLASHKKKHTGRKNKTDQPDPNIKPKDFYECEFCDFICKQRRQMAGHRASHSNMIKKSKPSGKERDHMCSICGKILSTRGSFFVHMKYHNDQRDYSCKQCDKKFYSKRDVAMHVESFHEKKVFECELCGVKCTWKNALYKHMRKHDAAAFKHECSYCGKKFIAANELRVHIWRHTGQQLNCEICGAGYRFNFLLTQHKIREHGAQIEGVKLYKRFQKGKGKDTAKRKDQPTLSEEQQQEMSSSSYPTSSHVEHHPMVTQHSFHETPDHGGSFQQVSNY